jgi:hypothetical protein
MKKGVGAGLVVLGMVIGSVLTMVLNPIGAASALVGASSTPGSSHESILQQALDTLVGNKTITQAQANAVTNQVHSLEQKEPHHFRMHEGFGPMGVGPASMKQLVTLLKIDPQTLLTELRSGKSIADIAKEKGVDLATIEKALVTSADQAIDQAVAHGWLTSAQATSLKAKAPSEIDQLVNRKGGFFFGPGRRGMLGGPMGGPMTGPSTAPFTPPAPGAPGNPTPKVPTTTAPPASPSTSAPPTTTAPPSTGGTTTTTA